MHEAFLLAISLYMLSDLSYVEKVYFRKQVTVLAANLILKNK